MLPINVPFVWSCSAATCGLRGLGAYLLDSRWLWDRRVVDRVFGASFRHPESVARCTCRGAAGPEQPRRSLAQWLRIPRRLLRHGPTLSPCRFRRMDGLVEDDEGRATPLPRRSETPCGQERETARRRRGVALHPA